MSLPRCVLIIAVSLLSVSTPGRADTVTLAGGDQIIGDILRSDDKVVIVEVGPSVLRLPMSDVVKIDQSKAQGGQTTTAPAGETTPGGVKEKSSPQWQLFRTAELQPTTIERNAATYGQAVVMVTSPNGQGSGFIITPDGYCITNYHVIARETRIKVTVFSKTATGFEQKHYKKVKIIALNPFVDLALLKIDGEGDTFTYAYLGDMSKCKAGQQVFAIGNPLGLTRTVSQGIISTTNRDFAGRLYIQTTTDINPGNSGGPLFNSRGEVIGVTSMGYMFLGGLNFAIPVDVVKRFIINRDAFAYNEDNPNTGQRYLQPAGRKNHQGSRPGHIPSLKSISASSPMAGTSPE